MANWRGCGVGGRRMSMSYTNANGYTILWHFDKSISPINTVNEMCVAAAVVTAETQIHLIFQNSITHTHTRNRIDAPIHLPATNTNYLFTVNVDIAVHGVRRMSYMPNSPTNNAHGNETISQRFQWTSWWSRKLIAILFTCALYCN